MDRKIAVLGDIHANLDALEVVLADARALGVNEYICTGDIVGYNACPNECCKIVRDLGCAVVQGNHDHYCAFDESLDDFNPCRRPPSHPPVEHQESPSYHRELHYNR